MTKFCDKCGAELKNENAKFCDKCGAEVKTTIEQSNSTSTTTEGVVICPNCGQTTPMGRTHCEKCGLSLEDNTTAVTVGYIVTLLLPLLGLIPAIYLVTRENKKAKTQGIYLIITLIIWILCNFIFRTIFVYIILIVLLVIGLVLWFKNYTLVY